MYHIPNNKYTPLAIEGGAVERVNCWEFNKCGHGPAANGGGDSEAVCPAALSGIYDGINGGQYAGRFCWAVPGTMCNDVKEPGAFVEKFRDCLDCNFLQQVDIEEGRFMVLTPYEVEAMSSGKHFM